MPQITFPELHVGQTSALCRELLIELLRYDEHAAEPSSDKMIYARNYIDENLNQKVSVAALVDLVGYSYDRFRHLFKEKYNMSPIRYLMANRVEQARRLLDQTDLSGLGGGTGKRIFERRTILHAV